MTASKNLSIGSSGGAVEGLQLVLNSRPPTQLQLLKVDGIFGPRTSARVKEFQSSNDLVPDGIVGPLTLSVLQGSGNDVPERSGIDCGDSYPGMESRALQIQQRFLAENRPRETRFVLASFPSLPSLPKLRSLTAPQEALAKMVYGTSIDFSTVFISDMVGLGSRPFTVSLVVKEVMNLGTFSPSRDDLIHELAHVWQAQHADDPTLFMRNSVQGQGRAIAANEAVALLDRTVKSNKDFPVNFPFSPYAYLSKKPFRAYNAEQIASQVEHGEAAIISHMASVVARVSDPDNNAGLKATAGIEDRRAPGVIY